MTQHLGALITNGAREEVDALHIGGLTWINRPEVTQGKKKLIKRKTMRRGQHGMSSARSQ